MDEANSLFIIVFIGFYLKHTICRIIKNKLLSYVCIYIHSIMQLLTPICNLFYWICFVGKSHKTYANNNKKKNSHNEATSIKYLLFKNLIN